MRIKVGNNIFFTTKIPKYYRLIKMLDRILENNKHPREYIGVCDNKNFGILINGLDINGIKFRKFYGINEIEHFFEHGKWQLDE